ncbi:hypothetical protein CYMTET_30334 [Cymbomonas tetramitiformis]|uniref:Uncharacterized protein n=1 Tax=Cymbomonas tetramitiformis TaxID=36881 RepID=A0AAE0FJ72_9CHLO|nr:hypothetical protein CYMTET_30334 [Cymbomonas tetramitiformis]
MQFATPVSVKSPATALTQASKANKRTSAHRQHKATVCKAHRGTDATQPQLICTQVAAAPAQPAPAATPWGSLAAAGAVGAAAMWGLTAAKAAMAPKEDPCLHWTGNPRDAVLGDLLHRANHYAITVSDVNESLYFYRDVLGMEQVKRPNFDRFGAWLTCGNLEVHLIKGDPVVPTGDHLVVGHLSVEVDPERIEEVGDLLKAAAVPFSVNKSVPNGAADKPVVRQFFLRDPDGYYIEICNCDILTQFVLGGDEDALNYNETSITIGIQEQLRLNVVADEARYQYASRIKDTVEDLVLPMAEQATEVDAEKLANMVARSPTWGDLMQGETEANIATALKEANNDVPLATRIIRAKKIRDGQVFIPPAIVLEDGTEYQPEEVVQRMKVISDADADAKMLAADPAGMYLRMFKEVDSDGSGSLDQEEVLKMLRKLNPDTTKAEVAAVFAKYDTDKSGEIDMEEFNAMCDSMLSSQSTKQWSSIFKAFDIIGHNKISVAEMSNKLFSMGLVMSDSEVEELFMDVDEDGSGFIECDEFVAVMVGKVAEEVNKEVSAMA